MQPQKPKLRFPPRKIHEIAARYEYALNEDELIALKPVVKKRGYLLKSELAKVAYWKSPRSAGHIQGNSDEFVKEVTGFALKAKTGRARIELLTVLNGYKF